MRRKGHQPSSPTKPEQTPGLSHHRRAAPAAVRRRGNLQRGGVEAVESANLRPAFGDYDQRLYVWTMNVMMRASFQIEDEDLEDAAMPRNQRTENWPAATWDKTTIRAAGSGRRAGRSGSRTIDETIAKVGGTAVSAAAQLVTFTAG